MLRFTIILLFLQLVWPTMASAQSVEAGPITSIEGVRKSPTALGRPVELEAFVTSHKDKSTGLYLQDATGGCYAALPASLSGMALPFGTRVHLRGTLAQGDYVPIIIVQELRVLPPAPMPEPRKVAGRDVFAPQLAATWIEVEGRVIAFHGRPNNPGLEIETGVEPLLVNLPQDAATHAPAYTRLLGLRVRLRGVRGTLANGQRQMTGAVLHVPDVSCITALEQPAVSRESPLRRIEQLLLPGTDHNQRVRVRGTVIGSEPGKGLYLLGERGGLFVASAQETPFKLGDLVEAEGLPVLASFRPQLRASKVAHIQDGPTPEAKPMDLSARRIGTEQGELVRTQALLTGISITTEGRILSFQNPGSPLTALLAWNGEDLPPELLAGCVVRITGICQLLTKQSTQKDPAIEGVQVHLRSAADIAIVQPAPWWNPRRLLWLAAGIGAVAVLVTLWAITLRRTVARQGAVIREQAGRTATLQERQRIARELHDSLEQELMGVNLLLEDANANLREGNTGAMREPLSLAEGMLRRCREESRASIRNLRSALLESQSLPAALHESLAPIASACGVAFTMQTTGPTRRLAGRVERNLLRIAHEAVTNAARHAQAGSIALVLHYDEATVTLEVRDDGQGFDATQAAPPGHFGLIGMQERADRIGGTLSLETQPGAGTLIRLTAPAHAAAESERTAEQII